MAAKITTDGLWRVSYGEDTKLTPEEVRANQPAKYERMLPGRPKPGDYKLLNVGPYRIHQRCSDAFRVGRICLAADAAHLCNPFGGLGLTGGIVDVGGLAECLEGIATGQADDSILDKYDEIRRGLWHSVINPVSSSNFMRVSATDPETAAEKDDFLATVKRAGHDEELREDLNEVSALCIYLTCGTDDYRGRGPSVMTSSSITTSQMGSLTMAYPDISSHLELFIIICRNLQNSLLTLHRSDPSSGHKCLRINGS